VSRGEIFGAVAGEGYVMVGLNVMVVRGVLNNELNFST
jgi:hypothetical protein